MPLLASWISPKTQKGLPSKIGGKGIFARERIEKNEVIVIKAGHYIDRATLDSNTHTIKDAEAQITQDMFIAPLTSEEFESSMAYMNHSCEPNAGFGGNVLVVAMRDIEPGEEITFDYAMDRSDPDYSLECNCQSLACRKTIRGNDWKIPELQQKYAGYFQWYIEQKIKGQLS